MGLKIVEFRHKFGKDMVDSRKKSVAIVVCAWPPNGGGIGNNAYYQAFRLAEAGYRVGVFTMAFKGIEKRDYPFEFYPLPVRLMIGKAGFMLGLFKQLKSFEVIHLCYPFFGSDLLVWLYKFLNPSVKLVIHYQMDPVASGFKGMMFYLHIKLFLGLLLGSADKIGILSSDHAENSYLRPYLGKFSAKLFELPNGVDTEIFQPGEKSEELMKLYNISVQDKIILFVGGLDDQHYFKGLPILLEAVSKIDVSFFPDIRGQEALKANLNEVRGEAKILIIGDGNLKPEFMVKAKELGLEKRAVFVGWINNADLPRYYNLADVFVLPSTERVECFGIVVAEAQSCEVPAVISDWPGVRETIKEGETGLLVKPGDSDDLSLKIKKILNDRELSETFGRAGRERMVAKYSWPQVVAILEKIYSEL
jgi:glycosyltransferase involved in cell wall biosynthesis